MSLEIAGASGSVNMNDKLGMLEQLNGRVSLNRNRMCKNFNRV